MPGEGHMRIGSSSVTRWTTFHAGSLWWVSPLTADYLMEHSSARLAEYIRTWVNRMMGGGGICYTAEINVFGSEAMAYTSAPLGP